MQIPRTLSQNYSNILLVFFLPECIMVKGSPRISPFFLNNKYEIFFFLLRSISERFSSNHHLLIWSYCYEAFLYVHQKLAMQCRFILNKCRKFVKVKNSFHRENCVYDKQHGFCSHHPSGNPNNHQAKLHTVYPFFSDGIAKE